MTELNAAFVAVDAHFHTEAGREAVRLTGIADSMRRMETSLVALEARHEARLSATKGRFNLFTILRRKEDEVPLHSRWLAFLLNPAEKHDCRALFLKEFIATLRQGVQPHDDADAPDMVEKLDSFDCDAATVRCEQWCGEGRMDIFIESPRWGIIAIENKIDAPEQPKQIKRYATALIAKCAGGSRNFLLLYLTRDGRPSEQAGEHTDKYHRISYHGQILKWLTRCLRETYLFPNINHALQQYAIVVRQLTGGGSSDEFMKELTELLTQYPLLIANMQQLAAAHAEIRRSYWQQFHCELQKQFRQHGIECFDPNWGNQNHIQIKFGPKHHLRMGGDELRWMLERKDGEGMWFGLAAHDIGNDTEIIACGERVRVLLGTSAELKDLVAEIESRFPSNFYFVWPTAKPNEWSAWWPLGNLQFSDDFLSDNYLAKHAAKNSAPIAEQVKAYCDTIRDFMETTTKLWPKF